MGSGCGWRFLGLLEGRNQCKSGQRNLLGQPVSGGWEWASRRVAVPTRGGPSRQQVRQAADGTDGGGGLQPSYSGKILKLKNKASQRALPHLYCGNRAQASTSTGWKAGESLRTPASLPPPPGGNPLRLQDCTWARVAPGNTWRPRPPGCPRERGGNSAWASWGPSGHRRVPSTRLLK